MSVLRISLAALGFVLILLFGAALYSFQQLPQLLEQQVATRLSEYGVQQVKFHNLTVSSRKLAASLIEVRGKRDGEAFALAVQAPVLRYSWDTLLTGRAQSLHIPRLELSLTASAEHTGAADSSVDTAAFFPQDYRALLPLARLEVQEWTINYQGADATASHASGRLLWEEQLDISANVEAFDLNAAARLSSSGTNSVALDVQLDLQGSPTPAVLGTVHTAIERLAPGLDSGSQTVQWQLEGDLQYEPLLAWLRLINSSAINSARNTTHDSISEDPLESLAIAGSSRFSANASHRAVLQLGEQPASALLPQLQIAIAAEHTILDLAYPPLVQSLHGSFSSNATLEQGLLAASLSGLELSGSVPADQTGMNRATLEWLQWTSSIPFSLRIPESATLTQHSAGAAAWRAHGAQLQLGKAPSSLHIGALDIAFDTTAAATAGEAATARSTASGTLDITLRKQALPTLNLSLQQQGSAANSTVDFQLTDSGKNLVLDVRGSGSASEQAGVVTAALRITDLPAAGATLLPPLRKLDLFEQELAFTSGDATLSTTLTMQGLELSQTKAETALALRAISGRLGDYSFTDLSGDARWTGIEKVRTQAPVQINIAQFNAGFAIHQIAATLELPRATPLRAPQLRINAFSANLFGGNVNLPQATEWDLAGQRNALTLRAQNWQLAELVALQQNQEIHAEGVLEGELPLTVESGRFTVAGGFLRALPPGGVIQYRPDASGSALASGSKELALALTLLEDFKYETLRSDVALDKAGNLAMGLALQGKNPAQQGGRSVKFNINLEQNIDPLLQSLRTSDKLIEQIERRHR